MSPLRAETEIGTSGFTLVEMLAVLVIIALVSGVAVMGLSRRGDRASVAAIAAETASRARNARDLAVRTGRDTLLVVDLAARTISTRPGARPVVIPKDVGLEVEASASERISASELGVRFFPGGASTGATIRVGPRRGAHEIRINWFTGRVVVIPPAT